MTEWQCCTGLGSDPGPPALECGCVRATAREDVGTKESSQRMMKPQAFENCWVRQRGTSANPKHLTRFTFFLSLSSNSLLESIALKLFFLLFQQYCAFNLVLGWNHRLFRLFPNYSIRFLKFLGMLCIIVLPWCSPESPF